MYSRKKCIDSRKTLLHVPSNAVQQQKCVLFEIIWWQCSSGNTLRHASAVSTGDNVACRVLNVPTHHCAGVLFKVNDTSAVSRSLYARKLWKWRGGREGRRAGPRIVSAIEAALSCLQGMNLKVVRSIFRRVLFLKYSALNNDVTLKYGIGVVQSHVSGADQ